MLKGVALKGKRFEGKRNVLIELEPGAAQVLHELVSLVHNNVRVAEQEQHLPSTSTNDSDFGASGKFEKLETADLEDDPVAKILWNVESLMLRNVFLAMSVCSLKTCYLHLFKYAYTVNLNIIIRCYQCFQLWLL